MSERTAASPLARRVGPALVVASLVVTVVVVLVVGVLAVPRHPTLVERGASVPAVLLLGPDGDGCATLLGGDGTERASACDARVAWAPARPLGGTEVLVQVVAEHDDEEGPAPARGVPPAPADPDAPGPVHRVLDLADGSFAPTDEQVWPQDPDQRDDAYRRVDGPRVLDDGEVLLELDGPRDAWPTQAVVSPDGAWLVVQDGYGRVLAAPAGGEPLLWRGADDDGWVDLATAVAWDG